jgi:uncharacterized protein
MDSYPEPKFSPLSQILESNGKSVKVDIYAGDSSKWILEVEDQYGNSTVWNEQFQTDRAALDEAIKTIHEEGIESLVGPPTDKN